MHRSVELHNRYGNAVCSESVSTFLDNSQDVRRCASIVCIELELDRRLPRIEGSVRLSNKVEQSTHI